MLTTLYMVDFHIEDLKAIDTLGFSQYMMIKQAHRGGWLALSNVSEWKSRLA